MRTRQRLWPVALLLALLTLADLGALLWQHQSWLALKARTAERAAARETRLQIERTLSAVRDMETGARGFLLTGDERFLGPYEAARAALAAPREDAAGRTATERAGRAAAPALDDASGAVELRLQLLEQLVALRRGEGPGAIAGHQALLQQGQAAMDAVRAEFAALDAAQAQRIAAINAELERTQRQGERGLWATVLGTLLILALVGVQLRRDRRLQAALVSDLAGLNAELEARVQARTAELSQAHQRIAQFAQQREAAIEAERRALAREVHDQLGQVFTAIRLLLRSADPEALPAAQREAMEQVLDQGVRGTRQITAQLRPPLLDDLGLAAALRHHLQAQAPGLTARVDLQDEARLSGAQAITLFRIFQEALTNVQRHAAGATHLQVQGRCSGSDYAFSVSDDGPGLDAAAPRRAGALGLVGMQERAELLGGSLRLEERAGGGLSVVVRLPLGAAP